MGQANSQLSQLGCCTSGNNQKKTRPQLSAAPKWVRPASINPPHCRASSASLTVCARTDGDFRPALTSCPCPLDLPRARAPVLKNGRFSVQGRALFRASLAS